MEGRRLILNDGTTIEGGEAGYTHKHLWCYMPDGYTMAQTAEIFLDPEKTAKIIFQYGDMNTEYDGFTECQHIMNDDGAISVCMVKGEAD